MQSGDFERLAEAVRNWGRWGDDDQRGTVNHIGPESLRRGAAEVTSGKLFSLGLNFDKDGPQEGALRFNPMKYVTALDRPVNPANPRARFNDDVIHMPLQCATQWDAFSHVHYDGLLYNGCKACDVLSTDGAARNGIEHLASPGIMSRGVLLDIARLNRVERLPDDHKIRVDELNRACVAQGVTIEAGDIVLVRTGQMDHFTMDRVRPSLPQPGLDAECAEWLYEKSVAAVAADNLAVEHLGPESFGTDPAMPLHMLCLRDMGMPLGELFNLRALAADCAEDGRYSFLLSAPPLALTGAFGSPVNPLALK